MTPDMEEVVERLGEIAAAVEFDKGDGITFRETGAVQLASDLRALLSERRKMVEAASTIAAAIPPGALRFNGVDVGAVAAALTGSREHG